MEHLDFILWMVLYPISISVENYFSDKAMLFNDRKEMNRKVQGFTATVHLLVYIWIAIILY